MKRSQWIRPAIATVGLAAVLAAGATVAQAQVDALDRPLLSVSAGAHPRNGIELGNDPTIRPSASVEILAGGFAPGAPVELRIACRSTPVGTVDADAQGTIRFPFTVPIDLTSGRHVLSLTGAVRPAAGAAARPSGNLVVSVPLVEYFRFSVAHSSAPGVTAC